MPEKSGHSELLWAASDLLLDLFLMQEFVCLFVADHH